MNPLFLYTAAKVSHYLKAFFFLYCDKEVLMMIAYLFYFILFILKNKFIENGLLYAKKRA